LAAFALGAFALGFAFSVLATGFIGMPQQTMSHVSQPHGSSTKTTSPQSSHLYLSPFLFAKNNACLKMSLYFILGFHSYKIIQNYLFLGFAAV